MLYYMIGLLLISGAVIVYVFNIITSDKKQLKTKN